MIETTAIRSVNNDPFSVVWDTGRRCNYDCTYCEATRHNNYSKYKTLEEYIETFEFIKEWASIQNSYKAGNYGVNINFTGGEPTSNPALWKLIDYIKNKEPSYSLSLTTNGAWGKTFSSNIIENVDGITVSYHAESHENLKKLVIDNILTLYAAGKRLQVNVMLHVDYWDETVEVYNLLKSKGVDARPRVIGDGNIVRKGWFIDSDGTNRRTSHEYTPEQQKWLFNEVGVSINPSSCAEGNQLGRSCCGKRSLEAKVENQWTPVNFVNTNFKDWHCMVDRFFLYVDQETRQVYHHQTCQALHNNKRGPLGSLDNTQELIKDLKLRLDQNIHIQCPNSRCGCGMCVPKAKELEDFNELKKIILVKT